MSKAFNKISGLGAVTIATPRQPRRIRHRPVRQVIVPGQRRRVFCKMCRQHFMVDDAIFVVGGGLYGHPSFWLCTKCHG